MGQMPRCTESIFILDLDWCDWRRKTLGGCGAYSPVFTRRIAPVQSERC